MQLSLIVKANFNLSYNYGVLLSTKPDMSTLEQIAAAILALPAHEFRRLRQWFLDVDNQRWDEQIEPDVADGKLDALAETAIAEFKAGHGREISDLDQLTRKQLQQVADFVAFLKFRNQGHRRVILDPTHLAALFTEFADEDRVLAEAGMSEYAAMLHQED